MTVYLNIVLNKVSPGFVRYRQAFHLLSLKKKKKKKDFLHVKLKSDLFGLYMLLYVVKSLHIALYKPIFLI